MTLTLIQPLGLVQQVTDLASKIQRRMGELNKISKIAVRMIKIAELTGKVASQALKSLEEQLKLFSHAVSALNLVNRVYELITPGRDSKLYRWQFWIRDPITGRSQSEWGWQKTVSRVFSTTNYSLKLTKFALNIIDKTAFVNAIKSLDIVTKLFIFPISTLGVWHYIVMIQHNQDEVNRFKRKLSKYALQHFKSDEIKLKRYKKNLKIAESNAVIEKRYSLIGLSIHIAKLVYSLFYVISFFVAMANPVPYYVIRLFGGIIIDGMALTRNLHNQYYPRQRSWA